MTAAVARCETVVASDEQDVRLALPQRPNTFACSGRLTPSSALTTRDHAMKRGECRVSNAANVV